MISILLPDFRSGGVERIRLVLAEEFVRQGYEVEFVVLQARGELSEDAEAHFPIRDLNCKRIRQAPLRLARYLRERQPEAMLAAMWPLTGVASIAVHLAGRRTRLVVSEHNDFRHMPSLKRSERWILRCFGQKIYGHCSGVVAVSKGVADSLRDVAGVPAALVNVIHNPVRPMPAEAMTSRDRAHLTGWLAGGALLMAVGTLKRQKGFDVLLHALARLRKWRDARLLILGEGALRGELERLVGELGLTDSVFMPGFRLNPSTYLEHADVFVLSSNWEGFGNVIVEAMAAGVSVVSTDCPSGPSEILADGQYGHLVPTRKPQALALAIRDMLENPMSKDLLVARAESFHPVEKSAQYLQLLIGDG